VADIVAIHKADLAGAEQAQVQVQNSLALSAHRAGVPVLRVSGRTGEGVEALWAAIEACPLRRSTLGKRARDLLLAVQQDVVRRLANVEGRPTWRDLLARWKAGVIAKSAAVAEAWKHLNEG
jgi:putative protein kinase ArgK-like GTPase of G3E family